MPDSIDSAFASGDIGPPLVQPVWGYPIGRIVGGLAAAIQLGRLDVVAQVLSQTVQPTTRLLGEAVADYLALDASRKHRPPDTVRVLALAGVARGMLARGCEADELLIELKDFNEGFRTPLPSDQVVEIALSETRRFVEQRHG